MTDLNLLPVNTSQYVSCFMSKSAAMSGVLNQVNMLSGLAVPALITGGVGSGKTQLAYYVAAKSAYTAVYVFGSEARQLTKINASGEHSATWSCKTLDDALVHAQGATLLIESCDALTRFDQACLDVFLDKQVQSGVLQSEYDANNTRILATSSVNLSANRVGVLSLQNGAFSPSCLSKLSALTWTMPALCERLDDVPYLVRAFCEQAAMSLDVTSITLSAASLKRLKAYHWPSNVRELNQLCVALTAQFARKNTQVVIQAEHLPSHILNARTQSGDLDLLALELRTIRTALIQTDGNKSRAAKLLGLSRDTLNYRLKKHGLV